MIDTFLKAFGIIISIVVLWFGLIMFSPVPVFSSSIIKLSYLSIIPCIATIASIAIAYKYSPKFKLGAGVLAMILSYIMAYPVFGAGLGLDVSLKLERYNYVPLVAMFLVGGISLYLLHKNIIGRSAINAILSTTLVLLILGFVFSLYSHVR